MKARLKSQLSWRLLLVVYLISLAFVGFWPTPVDQPAHGALAAGLEYLHRHGVPLWVDYNFLEASGNVAMFVPLGLLVGFSLPNKTWWELSCLGFLTSTCMELGQLLFLSARVASLVDITTNTFGAILGVIAARVIRAKTCRLLLKWRVDS